MRKTCNKIIITELSVLLWRRTDNFAAAGCLYPKSAVRKIAWNRATKCLVVFSKCLVVFPKCFVEKTKCFVVFSKCLVVFPKCRIVFLRALAGSIEVLFRAYIYVFISPKKVCKLYTDGCKCLIFSLRLVYSSLLKLYTNRSPTVHRPIVAPIRNLVFILACAVRWLGWWGAGEELQAKIVHGKIVEM